MRGRPDLVDDIPRMKVLLDDGASYREVARTFDTTSTTVRKFLPGYGWTQREGGEFLASTRAMEAQL